jgi:hypothetical protein
MTRQVGSRTGSPKGITAVIATEEMLAVDGFPSLDSSSTQHHQSHLHIHNTIQPTQYSLPTNEADEDDVSPPSTISAQVLLPFLNSPVTGTFKTATTAPTSNGQHSRGAAARANALGSMSRSSSARRRQSRDEGELRKEYLEILGDGSVMSESLEKLRELARERGVPGQLRKVFRAPACSYYSMSGRYYSRRVLSDGRSRPWNARKR